LIGAYELSQQVFQFFGRAGVELEGVGCERGVSFSLLHRLERRIDQRIELVLGRALRLHPPSVLFKRRW
jgi:hypothetical protein